MAFLCPVRIRRGKKKKGGSTGDLEKEVVRSSPMGRITGSASIETLVRVGIEKENGLSPDSKMVVLHDFTPCVDDELEVKRGQKGKFGMSTKKKWPSAQLAYTQFIGGQGINKRFHKVVNILYRENDWVYVIACDSRQEGFIPHSYCTPFSSQLGELAMSNVKKKLPRTSTESNEEPIIDTRPGGTDTSDCESYGKKKSLPINTSTCPPVVQKQQTLNNITSSQASLHSAASSQPDVHPFFKDPSGRYIVLYTFIARDENDLSVERGEFVTVLNREDPDWYWVLRSDSQEGFVPSGFVYPADVVQTGPVRQVNGDSQPAIGTNHVRAQTGGPPPAQVAQHLSPTGAATNPPVEEIRYQGTELVMLYDYKPQAPDDLSVRRGDWIYADLNNQTVDGWLWAYAPKTRKYGFIPKAYARPPAMTSL